MEQRNGGLALGGEGGVAGAALVEAGLGAAERGAGEGEIAGPFEQGEEAGELGGAVFAAGPWGCGHRGAFASEVLLVKKKRHAE